MFQSFEDRSDPSAGPRRLAAIRNELTKEGLAGFIVPRADRHQGEYVAPCDERLAWLTGFTGSAGFAVALADRAAIFIDGRYTLQVRDQVDLSAFSPVDWPKTGLGEWLAQRLNSGDRVGYDPWLHTKAEIKKAEKALTNGALVPCSNLVDRIWADHPAPPAEPVVAYPDKFAGKSSADKRGEIAKSLRNRGHKAAVITLPDSIAWLLNIRGGDIQRIPVVQAFAIIFDDGRVRLFSDPEKFAGVDVAAEISDWAGLEQSLSELDGPVRVDPNSAPMAIWQILETAGIEAVAARDPCILPKACKNPVEIAGARAAHLRDAAAMVEFLAWLDDEAPKGTLTEIDVVRKLEGFRRATNALLDISFETISGTGPNGAINHYRVTDTTNRPVKLGDLLLVDSGGQYIDGTTDITRTVAVGPPGDEERRAFTLVLKGMIAISRARWPAGLAGRDLDVLARSALWEHGLDYDHGTGHGVGAYLSVHEGPQRLSRVSHEPLKPGMILSNEPGYYKAGKFGIRIENLIVVEAAADLDGADDRDMLSFETLTWVPIDRRLIDPQILGARDRKWLNAYHGEVARNLDGTLCDMAAKWLAEATAPI